MAAFCMTDPAPGDPRHEFQFLAGYSPESATLIGTTTGARFAAAGFEYSYRCWAWKPVAISFTAGMLPVALQKAPAFSALISASQPPGGSVITNPFAPGPGLQLQAGLSHWVYGFGVTPVGFTLDFARTHAIYPFFEINGGIIVSTEPIPVNVPDATALNFLIDFGGGVKWRPSMKRFGFEAGYKFLHISNAFTTSVNPGVDNNVFYIGFALFR